MQIKDIINLNFTDNEKFYHVLYLLKLMLDSLITNPNTSIDTLFEDSSDTIKADSKKSFIPVTNSILANIATGLYSLCYNGLPSNYTNNEQTNANIFYDMVNECVDLDSKLSTNTSLNPKNILNYFVVYSHCIQGIDTQVLEYWNNIIVRSIPESFYATLGSKISNTSIKTDIPVIDIQTDSFELKDMEQYKEFLENQKALQAKNGITIPSAIFNIRANNVTLLSPTQVNDHINPTTVDKYNNIIQHEVVEIPKDIVQITKTIVQDNPVVKPQNIEVKQVPEIEDKRNTMTSNNDLENLSNDYNPQSPSISEDIPEDQTNFDMQYTEPNDDNNLQTMSTLSEDSDLKPESTEQSEPEVSISDDKPIENNFNPELNAGDEINSNDSTQDQNINFDFNSEPNSEIDSNPENNITPEVNTSPEPKSVDFNSEPNSEIDNTPAPENNFNMPAQDSNESNQENIQTENSKKATRLSRMSRSEQTLLQSLNSQFE